MTDVATLLAEYIDALNGGATPELSDFLNRAESAEARIELAEAIDGVLDLASDDARHPRAADGSFVLGISAERIAAAAVAPWDEAMPAWREGAGLSVGQLADRALETAGIVPSNQAHSAAARWIDAMESGAESARTIAGRAMDAIADALGVARDAFRASGEAAPPAAIAFRSGPDSGDLQVVSASIELVADALADAMPPAVGEEAVNDWFSRD